MRWLRTFATAVRRVLFPRFIPTMTRGASLTAVRVSLRSVNKFRSLVAKLHSHGCIVKFIAALTNGRDAHRKFPPMVMTD